MFITASNFPLNKGSHTGGAGGMGAALIIHNHKYDQSGHILFIMFQAIKGPLGLQAIKGPLGLQAIKGPLGLQAIKGPLGLAAAPAPWSPPLQELPVYSAACSFFC